MRYATARFAPIASAANKWQQMDDGTTVLTADTGSGNTARRIIRPPDSAPTVLVVVFHGHASDESQTFDANWDGMVTAFLAEGWATLSAAAYGPGWSSDNAMDEYEAAVAWARTALPTVTDVILVGQSMGGTPSLAGYAAGRYDDVRGWLGVSPVCDLKAMYDGSYTSSIEAAFGISGWDDVATSGRDPLNDLDGADFTGLFMRFYAASDDTTVPKADHTDPMVSLVSGDAAEASTVTVTGGHVSSAHYDAADWVSFIERAIA